MVIHGRTRGNPSPLPPFSVFSHSLSFPPFSTSLSLLETAKGRTTTASGIWMARADKMGRGVPETPEILPSATHTPPSQCCEVHGGRDAVGLHPHFERHLASSRCVYGTTKFLTLWVSRSSPLPLVDRWRNDQEQTRMVWLLVSISPSTVVIRTRN